MTLMLTSYHTLSAHPCAMLTSWGEMSMSASNFSMSTERQTVHADAQTGSLVCFMQAPIAKLDMCHCVV